MIRAVKLMLFWPVALLVLAIGSPLLWWLGRSAPDVRGELVIDPEIDSDARPPKDDP